ncbi:ferredoxin-fold anticodon-binding domain-containing protein 1-like isoform X2 [Leptotrombidium deliense]|uniref:Ferredoxin-fold anticodon-binding domain-containing protein 1-like isoform X2 n=1 Tax=Leptotrombidium deliense TaxID=299467 RepID=A0A443S7M1_9ACAR|nr:ferredoxin-fold anticodon-binding domain-containing protein 1-like isoform X2 [Leptotrombidium deliense]
MDPLSLSACASPTKALILRYFDKSNGKRRKRVMPIREERWDSNTDLSHICENLYFRHSKYLKDVEKQQVIHVLTVLKSVVDGNKVEKSVETAKSVQSSDSDKSKGENQKKKETRKVSFKETPEQKLLSDDFEIEFMMTTSSFERNVVLLLGEGNFSFAVSYLNHIRANDPHTTIIASDFKTDANEIDTTTQMNIEYLKSQKVHVILDLDARSLHEHQIIRTLTQRNYIFLKVIFNFPQTNDSKKMKIGSNRKLLREFFESVSNICEEERSEVYVSLCAGQGGTPVDTKIRKFGDSWQIVNMATFGGFILKQVEPFQCDYLSSGFRRTAKHFNTDGALTYLFVKREKKVNTCQIWNKIFIDFQSNFKDVFPLSTQRVENCQFDNFYNNCSDCQHLVVSNTKELQLFERLHVLFGKKFKVTQSENNLRVNNLHIGTRWDSTFIICVKTIAKIFFGVNDCRLLRSVYTYVDNENVLNTGSLFPPIYTHDVSFWIIDAHKWNENALIDTVREVLQSILKQIELLETFTDINTGRTSKCYRISHQSVDCALSKDDSNQIQLKLRNHISRNLEGILIR